MADQPRQHHFVPVFHLGGFTDTGTVDGWLCVHDLERAVLRRSKPNRVAHRRDWNRHDGATRAGSDTELDPFHLERELGAGLESLTRNVFSNIVNQRRLPSAGPDLNTFVNYVAFLMVRTPAGRALLEECADFRLRQEFTSWIQTEEGWTGVIEECQKTGAPLEEGARAHWVADLAAGNIRLSLDKTSVVLATVQVAEGLVPVLGRRQWGLRIAADGVDDFVCSDNPVGLRPTPDAEEGEIIHLHSEFGELSVPISRRLAVVSQLRPITAFAALGEPEVAGVNFATVRESTQVFSAEETFLCTTSRGEACRVRHKSVVRGEP